MKHLGSAFFVVLASASLVVGCLGRTDPDGDDPFAGELPGVDTGEPGFDTGIPTDDAVVVDSTVPPPDTTVGPDTAPPPPKDTGIDFFDIFPIPDSGPIGACASCVASNCSAQVNACLNDPTCRNGLTCVVTKCLGGGGPGGFDLTCVFGCFGGDFSKASEAISAFTCVTGKCGSACGGVLGGGGIPGTDGGAPPPRDGGRPADAGAHHVIDFGDGTHVWTESEVRALDPSLRMSLAPDAFDAWKSEIEATACAQGYASCLAK